MIGTILWRMSVASAAAWVGVASSITATPAVALVSKSGSQSCPSGQHVVIYAEGTGTIQFLTSGSVRKTTEHGDIFKTSQYDHPGQSASWKVTSNKVLSTTGTFSICTAAWLPPA